MFARLVAPRGLWIGVLMLAALAAPAAHAQYSWTQPNTGISANFTTAANWAPPGVPPGGGSATTTLAFNVFGGNNVSHALTNDVGAMTLNGLTFNHFGTGILTVAQGANTFTLDGTNPFFTINGPGSSVLSGAGGVVLNANATVNGGGNGYLSITSVISGAGGLTVNQTGANGIVSLGGANTFTGGAILNNGVLQIGVAGALGAGSNSLTVNGGAVRFGSAVTVANNITANANLVIAGGPGQLSATSTPTLTGVISGAGGLTVQNFSPLGISSGATLQGANTFTGPVVVTTALPSPVQTGASSNSILTLGGAGGTILAAASVTVGNNSTLSLSNIGGAVNTNRVGDTTPVTLNGGRFTFFAPAAATNETVGPLTVNGMGRLNTSAPPVGISDLTFGGFTRAGNSTFILESPSVGTINSGTNATRVFFTGASAASLGALAAGSGTGQEAAVLPYMIAGSPTNPRAFVGYDVTAGGGLQVIPHNNATYVLTQAAGAVSAATVLNKNMHFSGAGTYTLTGANTVNALTTSSSTVTVTGGTLTVFSGVITNNDALVFNNTNLDFQTRTAYLHNSWFFSVRGTSAISGSGGVVVSAGAGGRALLLDTSVPNTFTGGLTINGSSYVGFFRDDQLGAIGEPITINGGGLAYNAAGNATVGRPITLGVANGAIGFNQTNSNAGNTPTAATAATLLTLSGVISGPGALVKEGALGVGTVNLIGVNTYAGGTVVSGGTLQYTADTNLGAAGTRVVLNGGTLQPLAAGTLARPVQVNAASTILADVNVALSGGINSIGNLYGTANATLTKTGTGVLSVTAANPLWSGTAAVSAGGLALSGDGSATQLNAVTVAAGATLTLDNTGTFVNNRLGDLTGVALSGGLLNYLAPTVSSGATAEQFGQLTTSAAGTVVNVNGAGAASPTVLRFAGLTLTGGSVTFRGTDLGGTAGNYTRILFDTAPVANGAILPNVFFAGTSGSTAGTLVAAYDFTRGVIQFIPPAVSGTAINNFAPENVPTGAAFTTTGDATAATGAQVFTLTLDGGSTLTLNGGNAASPTNGNTPDGTLALVGGQLTSQNGAKTITSGAARTVAFLSSINNTVTTTSDLTVAANVTLTGTNGLTKAGAGTLFLNGGVYAVTGPLTVAAGTINTNGAALTVGDLTGTGGTLNTGAAALTVNQTAATTFAGNIQTSGGLIKTGTAALTLATAQTYTGATTVRDGTITLGVTNALPAGSALTLGNTAASGNGGTLNLNGFDQTVASLTLVASSAGATRVTGAGVLTVNGAIGFVNNTVTPGNAFPVIVSSTLTALDLGGAVRDVNVAANANPVGDIQIDTVVRNGGINFTGTPNTGGTAGRLGLSGANTFAGGLTINRGEVLAQAANTFSPNSVVTLEAGSGNTAILALGGNAQTIGGLASTGAGTNNVTLGSAPLTVNQAVNTTFGGVISGTGTLTKLGTGTLTLTGANTYTGATAVNGGVLAGTGTLTSALTVNTGAFVSGGSPANPTGTLATSGAITLTNNGGIQTTVNATSPTASRVSVTGAANVLNLNPGSGNTFALRLVSDPASPMVNGTPYTVTLASVLTAGNIQLNGSTLGGGTILPPSTYSLTSPEFSSFNSVTLAVDGAGTNLVLTFTPVPEPATVFALGGAVLAAGAFVRRRLRKGTAEPTTV